MYFFHLSLARRLRSYFEQKYGSRGRSTGSYNRLAESKEARGKCTILCEECELSRVRVRREQAVNLHGIARCTKLRNAFPCYHRQAGRFSGDMSCMIFLLSSCFAICSGHILREKCMRRLPNRLQLDSSSRERP